MLFWPFNAYLVVFSIYLAIIMKNIKKRINIDLKKIYIEQKGIRAEVGGGGRLREC